MTPSHRGIATSAAPAGEAVLLKDEYGNMDASGQTYVVPHFTTESGYVGVLARGRRMRGRRSWGGGSCEMRKKKCRHTCRENINRMEMLRICMI